MRMVKRFEARDMAEALRLIREEFGEDAMILETRRIQSGRLGFGAHERIEVLAGVDTLPEVGSSSGSDARSSAAPSSPLEPQDPSLFHGTNEHSPLKLYTSSGRPASPPAEAVGSETQGRREMSDLLYSRAMAPPSERSVTAMRRDACLPRPPIDTTVPPDEPQSGGGSALRASFVERLLRTGIERDLAASILEACGSQLSEIRLAAEIVRRLVLAPTLPIGAGARVALVGPTGVGKTTTLAKLAATYALSGRRVALISTDTQRIGGAAQIQMYARMIGVPVEVIDSAGEMADAVARNASRDLVLIDTVGRNPRHDAHLGEIRELLDAAAPVEVHLTLAAPCGLRYLLDAAERFASLGASRLILTKLDEMPSWGLIPTLVERTGLPVSFLADGQDVPRHIQPANAGEIVAQILGSR